MNISSVELFTDFQNRYTPKRFTLYTARFITSLPRRWLKPGTNLSQGERSTTELQTPLTFKFLIHASTFGKSASFWLIHQHLGKVLVSDLHINIWEECQFLTYASTSGKSVSFWLTHQHLGRVPVSDLHINIWEECQFLTYASTSGKSVSFWLMHQHLRVVVANWGEIANHAINGSLLDTLVPKLKKLMMN